MALKTGAVLSAGACQSQPIANNFWAYALIIGKVKLNSS